MAVSLSLFVLLLFFLWKCQFGVDLTDEAFYAVSGWKLYPLGDRPFVHEVYNATRQFDILNFLVTRHFVPFSIYWIRVSACLALILAVFYLVRRAFVSRVGLLAPLVAVSAVLADEHFLYTWSYNHWARVLVPLASFWLLSLDQRLDKTKYYLAGLCLGLTAVAYQPLLAPTLLVLLLCLALSRNAFLWLLAGVASTWIPNGIYLSLHWTDWRLAVQRMLQDSGDYGSSSILKKAFGLWNWTHGSEVFWLGLLAGGIALWRPKSRIPLALLVAGALAFAARRFIFGFGDIFNRLYVSLAMAAAIILFIHALKNKQRGLLLVVTLSITSSFVMGVSSVNGVGVMHFTVLPIWILFFALVSQYRETRVLPGICFLFLVYISYLGVSYHLKEVYRDVTPNAATVALQTSPLKKLKTNPRRAFLIEKIAAHLTEQKYALAFPFLPGAYLFGDIRPSTDTTIIHSNFSDDVGRKYLSTMSPDRTPEIAFIAKTHPWTWGMVPGPIPKLESTLLYRYAACARTRVLESFDELEIWELDPRKTACYDS